LNAIDAIIDGAAANNNAEAVRQLHAREECFQQEAMKTTAVDAPDGVSDYEAKIELEASEHIINDSAAHEDKQTIIKLHDLDEVTRKDLLRTLAVDAPDGFPDDVIKHELEQIERIVDAAADHEDKEFVAKLHAEQEETARNWLLMDLLSCPTVPSGSNQRNLE
jgi:hypothetical protein